MTRPPEPSPPSVAETILADLLREVVHDLNGRAAALSGIAQLWHAGSEVVDPGYLDDEVQRVVGLAERVGLLIPPRARGTLPGTPRPTLLDPREVLEEVALLLGMLTEAEGVRPPAVEVEGDPAPVRADPWTLRMALVEGLVEAVRDRAREGAGSTLRVREEGNRVEVLLAERPSVVLFLGAPF